MTIIQIRFVKNNVKMIIIDFNACLVNFNLWFVHEYFIPHSSRIFPYIILKY